MARGGKIAIVTVHGTGDTAEGEEGQKWFQRGSAFSERLRQRLAAGHFDERTAIGAHLGENLLDGERRPAVKTVLGIAPGTTERATRQPDKDARLSRVCRFSLDAVKDLRDPDRLVPGRDVMSHRQDTTGQPLRRATRPMPRIGFTTVGCPTAPRTARSPGLSP